MQNRCSILKAPIAMPAHAPEWWRLLPAGKIGIVGQNRPLILDGQSAAMVLKYHATLGRDLVIDYEHQTLSGNQAPAAGWIKQLQWREGDGLWVKTEWTQKAAAYIAKNEYRYYSPVMISRESDSRIVAVINVALTNSPKTRNIHAIAAKAEYTLVGHGEPVFPNGDPIDETTLQVAKMMGISDAELMQYGPSKANSSSTISETDQQKINRLMGIDDQTWDRYRPM